LHGEIPWYAPLKSGLGIRLLSVAIALTCFDNYAIQWKEYFLLFWGDLIQIKV
jgi:hypothetical protein